ncbi:hypothetical protein NQ152_07450 [Microbacterium sp. zg.B48]|uniref:hypothetical protein n=1 Tax=unclassified Microbacterium TaxID=2609290 RepID=UPI00214AAFC1|nr:MULTISPECIES: hypothetical protein [unclassified Microbacterium]MCR2763344.1 hypothetical protein [Microbacterium sp. zg.B48]MCR2809064.1 hypothetical protein [Microbacterium sp. zg.B185]WIM20220.1 hypothetical protein QNO12_05295 [Microbacterium sp. zg-B185]
MSATQEAAPNVKGKRELPPGIYLVLGVVVVPALIALLTPRGFEPGTATFVHVAFAVVAGQTIAVLTAVGVLAAAIVRRSSLGRIVIFAVIAVVVTSMSLNTAGTFADQIVRAFA